MIDLGGTIRLRHPSDTINVVTPLLEQVGVTRIANITHLDCLNIPVYTAYRPTSKSLSTAQGKGITAELAICSAIMEGIEHYYGENVVSELISSFDSLGQEKAISPNELSLGFINRKSITSSDLHWSTGQDLISVNQYFFPTNYICMDFSDVKEETGIFTRSTTGLASGNTIDEAILHSLFEIIERNCYAEFKILNNSLKKSRLMDIKKIKQKYSEKLISQLTDKHIKVAIFDITNRFQIPSYHCIIADESPVRKLGNQSGTGTHFSHDIALCRAITEAAQSRLTYISGARDDMFHLNYQYTWKEFDESGEIDNNEKIDTNVLSNNFNDQVGYLLNILNNHGYERVICYKHTPENFPISVVHSIIPRLII